MEVRTNIPSGLTAEQVALSCRNILEGVARNNELLMRARPRRYPRLYSSGIRFRPELNQGRWEEFANCEQLVTRGYGDCDDLVAYRVAELRVSGVPATIRIYWRLHSGSRDARLYHVQVRLPNGDIEDPSRFLGMYS